MANVKAKKKQKTGNQRRGNANANKQAKENLKQAAKTVEKKITQNRAETQGSLSYGGNKSRTQTTTSTSTKRRTTTRDTSVLSGGERRKIGSQERVKTTAERMAERRDRVRSTSVGAHRNTTEVSNPVSERLRNRSKDFENTQKKIIKGAAQQQVGGYEKFFGNLVSQSAPTGKNAGMERRLGGSPKTRNKERIRPDQKIGSDRDYSQTITQIQKERQQAGERLAERGSENISKGTETIQNVKDTISSKAVTIDENGDWKFDEKKERGAKFKNWLVDLEVAGLQMAGDAALGAATGGIGAIPSMFARAAGTSMDQAENQGADRDTAIRYGLAIGGVEAATEKIGSFASPLKKVYGKGVADELMEKVLGKMAAKTTAGEIGQRTFMAALSEGLEEMVAEGVEPSVANKIYADALASTQKDAAYQEALANGYSEKDAKKYANEVYNSIHQSTSLSDILRAGSIGAAMGGILGGGANVMQAAQGAELKRIYGKDGIKDMAERAKNVDDDEAVIRATTIADQIAKGVDVTAGQVNAVFNAVQKQEAKDEDTIRRYNAGVQAEMTKNKYESPILTDEEGNAVSLNRVTSDKYQSISKEAREEAARLSGSEEQADEIGYAVAAVMTGLAGSRDVEMFTNNHPEARAVLESVASIELPKSNAEMREKLFAMSSRNYVETAREETDYLHDQIRGVLNIDMTQDYGSNGQNAFAEVMADESIDPRDNDKVMAASAFEDYYRAGALGIPIEQVRQNGNPDHALLSTEQQNLAYEAGNRDGQGAISIPEGSIVTANNRVSYRGTGSRTGMLVVDLSDENKALFTDSQQKMYRELARRLHINIHIVDEIGGANGYYRNGEVFLSMDNDRGLELVFGHELTHLIKAQSPDAYARIEQLVRERWEERGGIDEAIKQKQEQYKEAVGQNLSEEEALEEIIADATYEMFGDTEFIQKVCAEEKSLGKAILYAIRTLLANIRAALANSGGFEPRQNAQLLSNLDILSEFEDLWLQGLRAAARTEAAETEETRMSVREEELEELNEKYPEVRFSIADPKKTVGEYNTGVNDQGEALTEGQKKYFKDSKAVDENGNLVVVYHSTDNGGFTVFDPSMSDDSLSLFFTSNLKMSQSYAENPQMYNPNEEQKSSRKLFKKKNKNGGVTYPAYLNLKNPLIVDCKGQEWDEILDPAFNKINVIPRDGNVYDIDENQNMTLDEIKNEYGESFARQIESFDFDSVDQWEMYRDGVDFYTKNGEAYNPSENGFPISGTTREWTAEAHKMGFDGVIFKNLIDNGNKGNTQERPVGDVYVAFESNQVKDIRNENPTEDADIRYSVREDVIETEETIQDIGSKENNTFEIPDDPETIRYSTKTHEEPNVKPVVTKADGVTGELFTTYDGEPVQATVIDMTEEIMRILGKSDNDIKKVRTFLDSVASFMKDMAATYKFVGINDVNNAEITIRRDENGNPVSVVLSAMVKNGEYPVNFDFSSVCKKREPVTNLINELSKMDNGEFINKVSLSQENLWKLNEILMQEGFETACLGCFVETKRYNIEAWADSFVEKWNAAVEKLNPNAEYFGFNGTEDLWYTNDVIEDFKAEKERRTKSLAKKRIAAKKRWINKWKKDNKSKDDEAAQKAYEKYWEAREKKDYSEKWHTEPSLSNETTIDAIVQSDPNLQKKLQRVDLISPEGIKGLQKINPDVYGVLYGHYGSGTPKPVQPFTPYNSEIAMMGRKKNYTKTNNDETVRKTNGELVEYLREIGGLRTQSFSDFLIQNVFDYMQMISDMAARGFPGHAYSKEIAFAKIFGMTGLKINMSIMFDVEPDGIAPGLDKDGNYVVADKARQEREKKNGREVFAFSFDWEEAKALQDDPRYDGNVGTIGVGLSDLHIRKMLSDPHIKFIIPYHKSGLPKVIAERTSLNIAEDYTDTQNTLTITSIKDKDGKDVTKKFGKKYFNDLYKEKGSWKAVFEQFQKDTEGFTIKTKKAEEGTGKFDIYTGEKGLDGTQDPKATVENYFQWCMDKGYLPLFYQFADHENYYKLLYDFNVYKNDGTFAPQNAVENTYPEDLFDIIEGYMKQANDEKKELAPKMDVVKQRSKAMLQGEARYSLRDEEYMDAVERGDMETAQQMVDEAAEEAGYTLHGYHGTNENFVVFDPNKLGTKNWMAPSASMGFFIAKSRETAESYTGLDSATAMGRMSFSTEGVEDLKEIRSKYNADEVEKKFLAKREQFFEKYKANNGYKESVDDVVDASVNDNPELLQEFPELKENLQKMLEYQWNEGNQNNMYQAWGETEEAKEKDAFDQKIYDEWEQRQIERLGYNPHVMDLYVKMENPFVHDFEGEGRDVESFAARMKKAKDNGHDGCIFLNVADGADIDDIYTVFDNTQIKSADPVTYDDNGDVIPLSERFNENDDDIRYSLPEDNIPTEDEVIDYINMDEELAKWDYDASPYAEAGKAVREKSYDELKAYVEKLKADKRLTHGRLLDTKPIRKDIVNLLKTMASIAEQAGNPVLGLEGRMSKVNAKLVNDTVKNATKIYKLMKNGHEAEAVIAAMNVADDIVERIQVIDDSNYEEYKQVKDYLRSTPITISEEDSANIPDFKEFKKGLRGKVRIVKEGGLPVDSVYEELMEMFPGVFDEEITHPANQLMAIADIRESFEPYDVMLTAEEREQLLKDTTAELLDIIAEGEPWRSWADKKAEQYQTKVKMLQERHREAQRDLREKERERAERLVQEEREKGKARLEREKERSARKEAELKEKAREQKEKAKDKKQRVKEFGSINKNYKWLSERLLKPTDDKHIPDGYNIAIAELLMALDLQTERSKALEEKTGRKAQKTFKFEQLRREYEEIANPEGTGIIEYDDNIVSMLKDSLSIKLDGQSVDALDTQTMGEIDTLLKAIVGNLKNVNKAFAAEKEATIDQMAEKVVNDCNKVIERSGTFSERKKSLKRYFLETSKVINIGMKKPREFFEHLGGGMFDAYMEIRRGEDKHFNNMQVLRGEFEGVFQEFNKKKKPGSAIEKWRDTTQLQTFELESGETIKMNPAQVMSLYCLMKREQAQGHILGSGIVPSKVEGISGKIIHRKHEVESSKVMVTYEDVQKIIGSLTEEQTKMADRLQELLNGQVAKWGNQTSLLMYNYEKFTEKNYFPIKSSDAYLDSSFEGRTAEERIRNFGFTKGTITNANNPIVVADIFEVVTDHCNKMSLYNSFAAPLADFTRMYNTKFRNEDGTLQGSVKEMIKKAYGKDTEDYIQNLMADINNNTQVRPDETRAVVNKFLSNYKRATIGLNLRVAVQQPTAIVRAFDVIDPKYFVADTHVTPGKIRKDIKEMCDHCPIARWKSWGHNDVDMARDLDDIMMNKAWSRFDIITMGTYGALDIITWSKIWNAVKREVKKKNPNVEVGSEEYWSLCNDRASEVFDKTQVVDSVLHRSQTMRSKDTMTKMISSFMAEPTTTFNMLQSDIAEARDLWAEGEKGKAAKKLNRCMTVFLMNSAAVSAAAAVIDLLRGKTPDDDDKDKEGFDLWLANFTNNFIDNANPVKMIPYPSTAWDVLTGSFGTSNMAFEGWESLGKGMQEMVKFLKGDSKKSESEIMWMVADGIGNVLGIPVKSFDKDYHAIMQRFGLSFASTGEVEKIRTTDEDGNILEVPYKPTLTEKFFKMIGADDDSGVNDVLKKFGFDMSKEGRQKKEFNEKKKKVLEKCEGLSGSALDDKLWSEITRKKGDDEPGLTNLVENASFNRIQEMKDLYIACGGNEDTWEEKVMKKTKSAYKKTIGVEDKKTNQMIMYDYMTEHGMSEADISEVICDSDVARAFKKAYALDDEDVGVPLLTSLFDAGLTDADYDRLCDNASRSVKASDFASGEFDWPTAGTVYAGQDHVTSGFGRRSAPTAGASSYHEAIDIGAPAGTPVKAADGGKVVFAGTYGGYGNQVVIDHGNGTKTYYSHLQGYEVQKGQILKKGQQLGKVGSTGVSTGPHLDFKMYVNGSYVDPTKYLPK